jgi:hypothetical protein
VSRASAASPVNEPSDSTADPLSWTSIAAAVLSLALARPLEADDLLSFADLLDGFAELEKRRGTPNPG